METGDCYETVHTAFCSRSTTIENTSKINFESNASEFLVNVENMFPLFEKNIDTYSNTLQYHPLLKG